MTERNNFFRYCLRSMRLRTLPLSLAGIVLGVFLAASSGPVNALTVVFLILTTVCLQILSNLSNELGDSISGTDSAASRKGMHYSLMDGSLTVDDIKKLIFGAALSSAIFGTLMIWTAFGSFFCMKSIIFFGLGIAAIWSAMHYTLGRKPYGYRGLGDIFVLIFFGFATVAGGYFICSNNFELLPVLLPAFSIGTFSVAVLNVNNIRDMATDAATRTTVAIRLGERKARIYQTVLIASGWAGMIAYCLIFSPSPWTWLFVLTAPLYALHLRGVWTKKEQALDPMLPLLVMSTFAFAVLAGVGMMI